MNFRNRNFVRGLFLMGVAVLFGSVALRYPIGTLDESGAGFFPLLVSVLLFLVALMTIVRSHFVEPVLLDYNARNVAIVLASLVGFTVLSSHVNMTLGIVFLVFFSTVAGTSYSWVRNVKVSLGLLAIALAFKFGLGLDLPLF